VAAGEFLYISGQNMTTQQMHRFWCKQFENRHILKLQAYLTMLSLRRRLVATDD